MKKFLLVLLVFGMAGIVNAAVTDDFESYAPGALVHTLPNWYTSSGSSRSVETGIGVGGSQGVDSSGTIATLSKGTMRDLNHVTWTTLAVGDYMTVSADFQTNGVSFDDDRIGMINDHDTTSSSRVLGVQLDNNSSSPSGYSIEGYWDGLVSSDRRVVLVDLPVLTADTYYHFEVTITKLGAEQALMAGRLTTMGGALVAQGSVDTGTLGDNAPNSKYFTDDQLSGSDTSGLTMGGLWPMFKNQGAAIDNYSFNLVPEPMTLSLLGLGGLALLRRRRA